MKTDPLALDGLDAWLAAGRRLQETDPARFGRLLALARAYVATINEEEDAAVFASRLAEIRMVGPKPSA